MNKNSNFSGFHSRLSRSILFRYLLTLLLSMIGVILLLFLGRYVFSTFFIWQRNDWLYRLFSTMNDHLDLVLLLAFTLIPLVVTAIYMWLPMRYLDAVVNASEQLLRTDGEPLRLPNALKSVEDRMNLSKMNVLQNERAAKEAEQRKSDLIVYLAHDLKTPLTSVIGYLTLLRDEPQISLELRSKYTGIALDKALRLEELTNEFFEITRFNLTRITLEKEPVDLTRMLQQITSEFEPALSEKGLRFALSLPEKMEYECDADKMARVFDNLLRNAVNYSLRDSVISIFARREPNRVLLRVENKGKTIPPEKLSRVFEQFFRMDSSRGSQSGGAGLGLAIAKELVELHGGEIFAQSEDSRIAFTVSLPFSPLSATP